MAYYTKDETSTLWDDFLQTYYWKQVLELDDVYPNVKSIYIDFDDIVDYNSEFAYDILEHPDYYIEIGKAVISEFLEGWKEVNIRLINLPSTYSFRKINEIENSDVGKMIRIDGIVRKISDARLIITKAAWKCEMCGGVTITPVMDGVLRKPEKCASCGRSRYKTDFKLELDQSTRINFRYLEMQDVPENMEGVSQPRKLEIHLYDDIALTQINPGDRLEVVGIVRAMPIGPKNTRSAQMVIYIEANSITKKNKDWTTIELSTDDEGEIKRLAESPNLIEKFKQAIAPSIYGMDIIKEALVLQMFGGVPKKLPNNGRKRGDIHILLVGDPGTAKSEILMQVANIAPRAIYTSGKGTSAAGLTAAAVKDKNNVWTLEAGALVIADNGMVCIDEIDKMNEQDRGAIHTAMEQQVVTVNKAGIHISLPARCSILAAANPSKGRFDTEYSLSSQIELDPALITRFDAIFKLVDIPSMDKDSALARHIIDIHLAGEKEEEKEDMIPEVDIELLRKYIVYAKRIKPIMSDDVKKFLQDVYVKMRSKYPETGVVSVTPRQLEAMIRFAEASARLRLSEVVTLDDAKRAVRIVQHYLKDTAYDTDSGIVDIDMLYGVGSRTRKVIDEIFEYLYSVESASRKEVHARFGDQFSGPEIEQAIDYLISTRKIREVGNKLIYAS